MKKIFIVLFIVCSSSLVFSQEDSYKELLVEFMKSQGTLETMDSTFEQLSGMFGGMVDKEKLDAFKKEMFEDLVDVLAPIYEKHLTEQDLKDAVAMFNTPIGKKIAEKNPIIAKETMAASMSWGMDLGAKMQELMN